jgi:hypothetical protein
VECFKFVHDHRLELDERCFLHHDIMRDIKHYVMDNESIKVSEIIKKIEANYKKTLRHLDILNALKIIRGDVKVDINLIQTDLEHLADKY